MCFSGCTGFLRDLPGQKDVLRQSIPWNVYLGMSVPIKGCSAVRHQVMPSQLFLFSSAAAGDAGGQVSFKLASHQKLAGLGCLGDGAE